MVFQLTYHSVAVPSIKMSDIEDIMEVSVRNNNRSQLTGCLMYNNGFFLQILEGEEEVVRELFERIALDERNHHVTLLATDNVESRIFKEWAMAYYQFRTADQLNEAQQQLKEQLVSLSQTAKKPNFTLKVFWYNVRQLLLEDGYYKNNLTIVT